MKKRIAALLALLMAASAPGAMAGEMLTVYVAAGSVPRADVQRAAQALEVCVLADTPGLAARLMAGEAVDLLIGTPQQAAPFADMLLPLTESQDGRIVSEAYRACTQGGALRMQPVRAQHRQMAVNRALLEEMNLGFLLDTRENPVWQPMQLYQALEEAAILRRTALEIWPPEAGGGEGLCAMIQALYGGTLYGRGAGGDALLAGAEWMQEMVEAEFIGVAESREAALARFLAGETVIFPDWTQQEAALPCGLDIVTVPYPATSGQAVRAFEVVGVAALDAGDAARAQRAQDAAAALAWALADASIWADGAMWIPPQGMGDARLAAVTQAALGQMIAGSLPPEAAVRLVEAAGRNAPGSAEKR